MTGTAGVGTQNEEKHNILVFAYFDMLQAAPPVST